MAKRKKGKARTTAKSARKGASARSAKRMAIDRKALPGSYERVDKTRTKTQVFGAICEYTGLTRKDVGAVFETLSDLVGQDLKKGPGSFTIPGLIKMRIVRKPATKARKGRNPFTGEEVMFKARPARNVVRARPLKGLKDAVSH